MVEGADPRTELLERDFTVLVRQRVDDVVDVRRALEERIQQYKPRRQIVKTFDCGQEFAASGDLVFELAHGHDLGSLPGATESRRFAGDTVDRVGKSVDHSAAEQFRIGKLDAR